jgi:hypothetical protein
MKSDFRHYGVSHQGLGLGMGSVDLRVDAEITIAPG